MGKQRNKEAIISEPDFTMLRNRFDNDHTINGSNKKLTVSQLCIYQFGYSLAYVCYLQAGFQRVYAFFYTVKQ